MTDGMLLREAILNPLLSRLVYLVSMVSIYGGGSGNNGVSSGSDSYSVDMT